jgi:hypothetical protein
MAGQILNALQQKYPGALYSYFRIANQHREMNTFMIAPSKNPVFTYRSPIQCFEAQERIDNLRKEFRSIDDSDKLAQDFLYKRLLEAEILYLTCLAREEPSKFTGEMYKSYRDKQVELYGQLNTDLFYGVLGFLSQISTKPRRDPAYLAEINAMIVNHQHNELYIPSNETFQYYRQLYRIVYPEFNQMLDEIAHETMRTDDAVNDLFGKALNIIGADKAGWSIVSAKYGGNIIVSKAKKQVIIPVHLKPQSNLRLRQLIAHEVGGHVYRALYGNHHHSTRVDEEGLCIVLEQLQQKNFSYKRSMRYMAICLAWGIDGKPRTFSQVYEIMWRAFMLLGHNKNQAKARAFNEVVRTFRGGVPERAGMCFIKDKIYLESNIAVWQNLENNRLDATDFKELMAGHGTMHEERRSP